jgi:hypothetical protein
MLAPVAPAQQRNAPYARKTDQRVYDARHYRSAAAAYGRNQIELEYADQAPVYRADYHEYQ